MTAHDLSQADGQAGGRAQLLTARAAFQAAGTAMLAALVVNVLLWVGLTAGGTELVVTHDGSAMDIGAPSVVAATAVPMLLGGGLLALLTLRTLRSWQLLAWLGVAVAVLTLPMPLFADATTGTRAGLASMHLVAGAIWWTTLTRTIRRLEDRS